MLLHLTFLCTVFRGKNGACQIQSLKIFFLEKRLWSRARRLPNSSQPVLLESCMLWMLLICADILGSGLKVWTQTQATNPKSAQGVEHCTLRKARARWEGRCQTFKGGTTFRCGDYWDWPVPDFQDQASLLFICFYWLWLEIFQTLPAFIWPCPFCAIFPLCYSKNQPPEDTHLGSCID